MYLEVMLNLNISIHATFIHFAYQVINHILLLVVKTWIVFKTSVVSQNFVHWPKLRSVAKTSVDNSQHFKEWPKLQTACIY